MNLKNKIIERFRKRLGLLTALCCCLFILGLSRGGFDPALADQDGGYYQRLSSAFLSGQLHLQQEVPEVLLNASNPYAPEVSAPFRTYGIHDAILWKGKFYYYWAPGPVVFWVVPASVLGLTVTEADVGLWSLLGSCVLVGLIMERLTRRRLLQVLVTCAISLGFSSIFLVTRLAVWEAGVLFALFWTASAIYLLIQWLQSENLHWLYLSSVSIAIAASSRPEAALTLLPVVMASLTSANSSNSIRFFRIVNLVLPVFFVTTCLLCYNKARFGSFSEFGVTRLIGGLDQTALTVSSLGYLPTNLANYLFRPLGWSRSFPFLELQNAPLALSGNPPGTEVIVGFLWTHFWLVPLVVIALWNFRNRWRRPQYQIGLLLFCAGLGQIVFVSIAIFGASERYRTVPDLLISLGVTIAVTDFEQGRSLKSFSASLIPLCICTSILGAMHGYYPDRVPRNAVISSIAGLLSPLEANPKMEIRGDSLTEHDGCVISTTSGSTSVQVSQIRDITSVARVKFVLQDRGWTDFRALLSFGSQGASDVFGMSWDGKELRLMRDRWRESPTFSARVRPETGVTHEIVVSSAELSGEVLLFFDGVLIYQSKRPLLSSQLSSWGNNSLSSTAVAGDVPISVSLAEDWSDCVSSTAQPMVAFDSSTGCISAWLNTKEEFERTVSSLATDDIVLQVQANAVPTDGRRYPIATWGMSRAGDVFSLSRNSDGLFVYHDHWGTPLLRSSIIQVTDSFVELAIVGDLSSTRVLANGREVLKTRPLYGQEDSSSFWRVGRNDIGASTSLLEFESIKEVEVPQQCTSVVP